MGKRTAQKDTFIDITSESQVNSNFQYRWSPASNFIAGRPRATLVFFLFGDFRCGVSLSILIRVIYKYRNR